MCGREVLGGRQEDGRPRGVAAHPACSTCSALYHGRPTQWRWWANARAPGRQRGRATPWPAHNLHDARGVVPRWCCRIAGGRAASSPSSSPSSLSSLERRGCLRVAWVAARRWLRRAHAPGCDASASGAGTGSGSLGRLLRLFHYHWRARRQRRRCSAGSKLPFFRFHTIASGTDQEFLYPLRLFGLGDLLPPPLVFFFFFFLGVENKTHTDQGHHHQALRGYLSGGLTFQCR